MENEHVSIPATISCDEGPLHGRRSLSECNRSSAGTSRGSLEAGLLSGGVSWLELLPTMPCGGWLYDCGLGGPAGSTGLDGSAGSTGLGGSTGSTGLGGSGAAFSRRRGYLCKMQW